ncbi:MAG: LemA family protein [Clostridium sp.]|nr:MAG: LemA family protein [Clostridium sp.]
MFLIGQGALIGLIIAAIVVLAIVIIISWYISVRNSFVRMLVDIDNSSSRIDVYLTKRFDLLTKKCLIQQKGYMKHEHDTLTDVISMRQPTSNASMKDKSEFNNQMTEAAKQINLVVERYPELKASQVFMKLQSSIEEVEENLQAARSTYNSNVAIYNKKIAVFPNSIVAGSKFTKRDFFEAEASKRQDVKMEFLVNRYVALGHIPFFVEELMNNEIEKN